jgi:hypothetical protein
LRFINSLAVAGLADLPTAADALNGTVTFIRFESKTYAITAQHVVKLLRGKAAQAHPGGWLFSTLLGIRGQSLVDRFVPAFPDSFKQPSAQHPDEYDVALTEINEGFLEAIGKVAVPFERDAKTEEVPAFAVGYPTEEEFDVVDDGDVLSACGAFKPWQIELALYVFTARFSSVPVSDVSEE